MASIFEAFDSTMKEAFAGVKVLLWGIPFAYAVNSHSALGNIVGIIAAFLLFGFMVTLAHGVITKKPTVVPGINFIDFCVNGGMGLVAVLPYLVLTWIIIYFTNMFIMIPDHPIYTDTARIVCYLLAFSFPVTALAIFIRRRNMLEAFNLKKFNLGYGEVFLSYSYLFVKLAIVSFLVGGFLVYIFYLFIGFQNPFWHYLMCSLGVFYVIISGNYIAQISDEVYTFPEKEEEKKREDEKIAKLIDEQK